MLLSEFKENLNASQNEIVCDCNNGEQTIKTQQCAGGGSRWVMHLMFIKVLLTDRKHNKILTVIYIFNTYFQKIATNVQ